MRSSVWFNQATDLCIYTLEEVIYLYKFPSTSIYVLWTSIKQSTELTTGCFVITNGVRQGGILSPLLFNVYMDGLSSSLSNTPTGCVIGGVMVNHIMYADVIISPSVKGLQRLLHIICAVYGQTNV